MAETENSASASLQRVQDFDPTSLSRREALGSVFEFSAAVEPARQLIALFRRIPLASIDEFPETEREQIKSAADNIYKIFDQIVQFDAGLPDAKQRHENIVSQISGQYQSCFSRLFPFVSYAMARTVDFNEIEAQARATLQQIKDESAQTIESLSSAKQQSEEILKSVRDAAAEQGVSQQSIYFSKAADEHRDAANMWQKRTFNMSIVVIFYGSLTIFIHKIPLLDPGNAFEASQLIASKILIFLVLTYILLLCGRNFMSNRHNEIVNRHRQNALMTYKALSDAGHSPESRDIILNHAAASIYQLHDTGYTRQSAADGASSSAVVEMLPRSLFGASPQ